MNILLMCMAGASTSLVMNKMKAALTEDQKDWKIEAHPFDRMDEVVENFDVILIGPQIAYKKKELQGCGDRQAPGFHRAGGLRHGQRS